MATIGLTPDGQGGTAVIVALGWAVNPAIIYVVFGWFEHTLRHNEAHLGADRVARDRWRL
jgi:hypothetical protein